MYLLLFANNFLGGPEVLDLQFGNAQKEPYTLCLRTKGPTLEHLETLTNLNRFSKFLHCWKAY